MPTTPSERTVIVLSENRRVIVADRKTTTADRTVEVT